MKNTWTKRRLLLLTSLFAYSIAQLPAATTATASAGGLFSGPATDTQPGSASWFFSNPTATDNINWSSGTNHADGQAFNHTIAPETKFTFTGIPPVIGGVKAYKGFAFNDCSAGTMSAGSCATTSGAGSSKVGKIDTATWTVTAAGKLGAGIGPSYDSTASGNDPWTLSAAQLSGFSGGYSLFFASELDSASFSVNGSVDFNIMYATGSGSLDLLDVALDATGAHVLSPSLPGLSIYAVPSVDVDPATFTASALSLSQIQSLFQSDLSGNTLTAPITLGFVLSDLPIPSLDMGDGVVAQVHETATANDDGLGSGITSTPEPSTLSIFIGGTAFLGLCRLMRKRFQRSPILNRTSGH